MKLAEGAMQALCKNDNWFGQNFCLAHDPLFTLQIKSGRSNVDTQLVAGPDNLSAVGKMYKLVDSLHRPG